MINPAVFLAITALLWSQTRATPLADNFPLTSLPIKKRSLISQIAIALLIRLLGVCLMPNRGQVLMA